MKWLIVAALVYFLWPYDLLPDFLGLPGRIDDVVIMGWLAWFYRNHLHQYVATGSGSAGSSADSGSGQNSSRGPASEQSKSFDAYEVLGVSRSASDDAIRAAYRARMKEYHPDKVAHLGEELQQLANEKSQQIQRAYRKLHG
jgi:hypothetical protein